MTDTTLNLLAPTKTCTKCGQDKVVPDDFPKDARNKDGLFGVCKACMSERSSAWAAAHPERVLDFRHGHYNIDFNAMWERQGGLCAMCGEAMLPRGKSLKSVVIDHDHACCPPRPGRAGSSCGKCVRGLIHRHCNMLLGVIEKNQAKLVLAGDYLRQWREGLT